MEPTASAWLAALVSLAGCSCGGSTAAPSDASTERRDAIPDVSAEADAPSGLAGFDAGDDGDVDAPEGRSCSGASNCEASRCLCSWAAVVAEAGACFGVLSYVCDGGLYAVVVDPGPDVNWSCFYSTSTGDFVANIGGGGITGQGGGDFCIGPADFRAPIDCDLAPPCSHTAADAGGD
jgi:hypothetical protein